MPPAAPLKWRPCTKYATSVLLMTASWRQVARAATEPFSDWMPSIILNRRQAFIQTCCRLFEPILWAKTFYQLECKQFKPTNVVFPLSDLNVGTITLVFHPLGTYPKWMNSDSLPSSLWGLPLTKLTYGPRVLGSSFLRDPLSLLVSFLSCAILTTDAVTFDLQIHWRAVWGKFNGLILRYIRGTYPPAESYLKLRINFLRQRLISYDCVFGR